MVTGWLHVLFMLNFELMYLKLFLVKNANSESLKMYSLIQYSTVDLSQKSANFSSAACHHTLQPEDYQSVIANKSLHFDDYRASSRSIVENPLES